MALLKLSDPAFDGISGMSQFVHKDLAEVILEIVEVTPSGNGFAAHVEVAMSRSREDVAGQPRALPSDERGPFSSA